LKNIDIVITLTSLEVTMKSVKQIFVDIVTGKTRHKHLRRISHNLRKLNPLTKDRHQMEVLSGPVGYSEEIGDYQLRFLKSLGLEPHHTLLDIGCGPLVGGIKFIDYLEKGNYYGVDTNDDAIATGLIHIIKHDLLKKNSVLILSHSFGNDELRELKFDFILASQILYHLDESLIDMLFRQLRKRMHANSRFYCDIIGYPNLVKDDSSWQGYRFYLHSLDFFKSISEKYGYILTNLGQIEKYGYPSMLGLKTNIMMEFRLKPGADVKPPAIDPRQAVE